MTKNRKWKRDDKVVVFSSAKRKARATVILEEFNYVTVKMDTTGEKKTFHISRIFSR